MNNTEKIIERLPFWFKIKKNLINSDGYKLLNISGKDLDFAEAITEYAYNQLYIDKMDINYPYYLYKIILPSFLNLENISSVNSNLGALTNIKNLTEFLGINTNGEYVVNTTLENTYYIDKDKNILYTRKSYDVNSDYIDGKLTINLTTGESYVYPQKYHHIWNQFDEIGYLLNLNRIYKEDNISYKKRLLDVFVNLPGASNDRLLNAIGRELNLRKEITWINGAVDLIIESNVDPISIKVDNKEYENEIIINENNIILTGDINYSNISRTVSYITGIKLYSIVNPSKEITNELYNVDGSATEKLIYYKNKIHSVKPIMWNSFKWDEACWDSSQKEIGSAGAVTNIFDAKIEGFTKVL